MSFEKFTSDNAAMLLIDHQVGTMGWLNPWRLTNLNAMR
jgi:hypothetical protein